MLYTVWKIRSQINAIIATCIKMIQSNGTYFPHFNESILAYINTSKLRWVCEL